MKSLFKLPVVSMSGAPRVSHCTPSVVLPQARSEGAFAAQGTALHLYLSLLQQGLPREFALLKIAEEHRDACAALELDKLPVSEPSAWRSEDFVAWNWETGEGRVSKDADAETYDHAWVRGRVDVYTHDPEWVTIIDYKSGRSDRGSSRDNWQLVLNAEALVAALRVTKGARVAIASLKEDGAVYLEPFVELDVFDLALKASEWREIMKRVASAWHEHERTKTVQRVYEGSWCRYCPAFDGCPAKTTLARALATPSDVQERFDAMLSRGELAQALFLARSARQVLDRIDERLEQLARERPIPTVEGKLWGVQYGEQFHYVDTTLAVEVLRADFGDALAELAVEKKLNGATIERAVKEEVKKRGVPWARAERELRKKMEAAKAGRFLPTETMREFKPLEEEGELR